MYILLIYLSLLQFVQVSTSINVGKTYKPKAFRPPTLARSVNTYLSLASRPKSRKGHTTGGLAQTHSIQQGHIWYANLQIEGQTYAVVIDTGSSDTWLAKSDFQCHDPATGAIVSQSQCLFGPGYSPGAEFAPIPDEHFNTSYPDGENLKGTFGFVNVNLGGVTVNSQIAVVDNAIWFGDGVTSGLLGLAYPSITAAFRGTTFDNDNAETQLPYNPIFTTMYTSNLIPPLFSLALSRPSQARTGHGDGYLALGGLPPVASYGPWATAPIEYVAIGSGYLQGALPWPQHQVYTISPNTFIYHNSTIPTPQPNHKPPPPDSLSQVQLFIDSGTTLIYLPNRISSPVAALYTPPAIYNPHLAAYSVPCTAIPPYFAVVIQDISFPIDAQDMIQDDGTGTGACVAAVNDGDPFEFYTLGDVWLKNVVVVFDVGSSEVRVRARGVY